MSSLRRREGYLMIDNRASGGTLTELPTLTCGHCQGQMIRNPTRTRERPHCRGCDHYICDQCKLAQVLAGGGCQSFKAMLDRLQERAFHAKPLILSDRFRGP